MNIMSLTNESSLLPPRASPSAAAEADTARSAEMFDFLSQSSTESLPYQNSVSSASRAMQKGDVFNSWSNGQKGLVTRSRPSSTMSLTNESSLLPPRASPSAAAEADTARSAEMFDFLSQSSTESLPYQNSVSSASRAMQKGDVFNSWSNGQKGLVTRSRPSSTRRLKSPLSPDGLENNSSPPPVSIVQEEMKESKWQNSVRVLNVPPEIVDLVELYLESPLKGGGDIETCVYDPEAQHVTVVFVDLQVAERIVKLGSIKLHKQSLLVARLPVEHQSVKDGIQLVEVSPKVKPSKVVVSGIEPKLTESILTMYFENTKRSGGGPISKLTLLEQGKAVIDFVDARAAEKVLQKSLHTLTGVQLQVTPFNAASESFIELKSNETQLSCAIVVHGLTPAASPDMISLFFENRKRSGGGLIEDLVYIPEEGRAIITFESTEVVDRIVQKHSSSGLQFNNRLLDIKPLHPVFDSFEAIEIGSEVDKLRLIIFKLPMSVCTDDIERYFQRGKMSVQNVLYSCHPGVAMVEFPAAYDSHKVIQLVRLKPLKDVMIGVQKVLKPDSVQVNGIGTLTDEVLLLYFENPRRFGSIEVESVRMDDGFAVVKFANLTDLSKILDQDNEIEGTKLEIVPFIANFSPVMLNYGRQPCWIPPNLSVTFDARVVDFITRRANVKADIEKAMSELGSCSILWPNTSLTSDNTTTVIVSFSEAASVGRSTVGFSKRFEGRLLDLLSSVRIQMVDLVQEMWSEFKSGVDALLKDVSKDDVSIELDDNSCTVIVIGSKDLCDQVVKQCSEQKAALEEEFRKRKAVITETLSPFSDHHLALLKKCSLLDQLAEEKLSIEVQNNQIVMKGMTDVILQRKLAIYQLIANTTKKAVTVDDFVLKVLRKKEFEDYVVDSLQKKSVTRVVWECSAETGVTVYGVDQQQVDIAISELKNAFLHQVIPLDGPQLAVLKSPSWADRKTTLLNDYKTLDIVEPESSLVLTLSKNIASAVLEIIQSFLQEHTVRSEFLPVTSRGVKQIVELYLKDDLAKICLSFTSCAVSIRSPSPEDSCANPGFIVSGTVHGLKNAVRQLENLTKKISERETVIDAPGLTPYLRGPRGKKIFEKWSSEHSAFIEEVMEENIVALSPAPTAAESVRLVAEVKINAKFLLKIVVGDITSYDVDVIVNAANSDLDHAGGLARCIVDKGGREIQDECTAHVKKNGRLLPAQFFVSSPGRLRYKAIIHAVGPIWSGGQMNEVNTLYQTVFDALAESDRLKFYRIALPAISTGIFRFPLDSAAQAILEAILDFSIKTTADMFEVHLIDQSLDTVRKFAQMSGKVFKDSASIKWHEESILSKAWSAVESAFGLSASRNGGGDQRNPADQPSSASSLVSINTLCTAEGITITLDKGSIVDQQVDVIVNTTSADLNLANGAISRLLLASAGSEIQDECRKLAPSGLKHGDFIVTKAYGLRCTAVYHGACLQWDQGAGKSQKVLRKFVQNVLKKAHTTGCKSIAMPAIGTGNLRIPADLVAQWMFCEVEDFSQKNRNTALKDIRFVIYAKDTSTLSAFEKEIQAQSRILSGSGSLPRPSGARHIKKGGKKSKDSGGGSRTSISGAWKLKMGKLTIIVKQGDITEQTTDVIVNLTNATLRLDQGTVSKAILAAAGSKVADECRTIVRTKKWRRPDLAVTSAGELRSKCIFHAVAANSNTKEIVKACLEEAALSMMDSITFPLIGTGMLQRSPAEMATVMLDAVSSFSAKHESASLTLIQIIIFSAEMFKDFAKGIQQHKDGTFFDQFKDFFRITRSKKVEIMDEPEVVEKRLPASSMRLRISALSEDSIKKILGDIDEISDELVKDKTLHDPVIAHLSDEQIARIQGFDNEFDVKIVIDKGARLHRIHIKGLSDSITEVVTRIYAIFREVDEEKRNQMESDLISKEAQWMYQVQDGYEAYPPEINTIIEQAYRKKSATAQWDEEDDIRFMVDFTKMIEQKVGDPSNIIKVKRNTPDSQLPQNWDLMAQDDVFAEIKLSPTSNEYKDVEKAVRLSASNSINQIISITRLQNPTLYRQYMVRKKQMEQSLQGSGVQVERMLWHGTAADTLESISMHGFNRSYCGKNAIVYGRGVYFAVNFSYSAQNLYSVPDTNGDKHIYLTRVLTGEFVVGNQSYIVPPSKAGGSGAADRYNSVVDNPASPQVFVIFSDTQAYPEYLIVFN